MAMQRKAGEVVAARVHDHRRSEIPYCAWDTLDCTRRWPRERGSVALPAFATLVRFPRLDNELDVDREQIRLEPGNEAARELLGEVEQVGGRLRPYVSDEHAIGVGDG